MILILQQPTTTIGDSNENLDQIDIIGILNREIAKTRVHGAVAKKVVQAIRHLDGDVRSEAILTLLNNLEVLYPIFPIIATTVRSCFDELPRETQDDVCRVIRDQIISGNFVLSTELHAAYALRILGARKNADNVDAAVSLHRRFPSPIVRRDVILAMAKWGEFPWLSDQMNDFSGMTPWERRAFIIGSFKLGDAGDKWRGRTKRRFDPVELLVREWAEDRFRQSGWDIPL